MEFKKLFDWERLDESIHFIKDVFLQTKIREDLKISDELDNSQFFIDIMCDKFLKINSGWRWILGLQKFYVKSFRTEDCGFFEQFIKVVIQLDEGHDFFNFKNHLKIHSFTWLHSDLENLRRLNLLQFNVFFAFFGSFIYPCCWIFCYYWGRKPSLIVSVFFKNFLCHLFVQTV